MILCSSSRKGFPSYRQSTLEATGGKKNLLLVPISCTEGMHDRAESSGVAALGTFK